MRGRIGLFILLPLQLVIAGRIEGQIVQTRISGTVTVNGAAFPGATIIATNNNTSQVRETTSDARGEFTLDLPPGPYRVSSMLAGFSVQQKNLVVQPGMAARLAFAFDTLPITEPVLGVIHGTVKSANGRVLEHATVEIKPKKGGDKSDAETDAKGEYEKKGLQPQAYVLTAKAKGHKDDTKNVTLGARESKKVDFSLKPQ